MNEWAQQQNEEHKESMKLKVEQEKLSNLNNTEKIIRAGGNEQNLRDI